METTYLSNEYIYICIYNLKIVCVVCQIVFHTVCSRSTTTKNLTTAHTFGMFYRLNIGYHRILNGQRADQLLAQFAVLKLVARDAPHLQTHVPQSLNASRFIIAIHWRSILADGRAASVADLQLDLQTTRILET